MVDGKWRKGKGIESGGDFILVNAHSTGDALALVDFSEFDVD